MLTLNCERPRIQKAKKGKNYLSKTFNVEAAKLLQE